VLKVSHYVEETRTEIEALRIWNGFGAASLLASDPNSGALLLERVEPGSMLAELADDDEATRLAAGLLRQLWLRPPPDNGLCPLEDWCAAYNRNRALLSRGVAGFPSHLFQQADSLREELLASTAEPVVLHGDLHHFNILRSNRAGWLSIDPKGLAGDPYFDLCQFLRNPGPVPADTNRRRLDIFCAELGVDRRRASQWALVHAVLDACWSYEECSDWRPAVAYAEQAATF
jgi:streptomycin 6-kinase